MANLAMDLLLFIDLDNAHTNVLVGEGIGMGLQDFTTIYDCCD